MAAWLVPLAGCGPAIAPVDTPPARPNLVLICIDTLRADALGSYGYDRATAPTIDRLAAAGVRFERAFAASTYTRESVAALLTGRLPVRAGHGWQARPNPELPNLARSLKEAGYRTYFASDHPALRAPPYTDGLGFDRALHMSERYHSGRADALVNRAMPFLNDAPGEPFLLYLHFLDPHAPYRPSGAAQAAVVPDTPTGGPGFMTVRQGFAEYAAAGFGPGTPEFEAMRARYDAEIRDVDGAIATLLDAFDEAGLTEHTIFLITADHGEEFMEHGFIDHSWTLYNEVLHVPFIVYAPGRVAPGVVEAPASLVDLYPTALALLDLPAPEGLDGQSLRQPGAGPIALRGRTGPVYAHMLLQERSVLHAVIDWPWSYIAAMRWVPVARRPEVAAARMTFSRALQRNDIDRVPLWGTPVREELYHLEDDWAQQHDRREAEPATAARLRERIDGRMRGVEADAPAPPESLSPEEQEALDALGYL